MEYSARDIEEFVKNIRSIPAPDFLPIGRINYKIYLDVLYKKDDHSRLKALYNAGYRGHELQKTCAT